MTESTSKKKFIFECQQTADPPCFKCCTGRIFNIYFEDLERWIKDQSIFRVFPNISIVIDNELPVLRFNFKDDGTCPMLIEKQCSISYSKPLNCQSIPLGFNGNNYYVQYKECEGLDKGEMNKEKLDEMKAKATKEFEAKTRTALLMPYLVQFISMFVQSEMSKASEEMMKSMDPKQREELEKILSESREKQVEETLKNMSPEEREKIEKLIKEKEEELEKNKQKEE
ncbi:MAG: hypothetical protein EAX96_19485 [Candidatus Lokiarchaeota archaeon]|nr:hypothetical protein [Candidatus Lokiarchaeota archaeon]